MLEFVLETDLKNKIIPVFVNHISAKGYLANTVVIQVIIRNKKKHVKLRNFVLFLLNIQMIFYQQKN